MRVRREVLDYGSQTYVDIYESGKCSLWVGYDKIKIFDCFDDAYNYWMNNYVM